ncbi:MFS transporter [Uliginosibacterium sp. 31-16]|uniref:MFS transporter n=1 Tax=Uliginosibacterium sp. 31-16 TaxID=3068315 RepID=UPI00273F0E6D|nr:MFS transporter [Uliginosibacterium sp. 31-16]MDP5238832.1 MFS transporter [Uliginosibacterium sp. 31-16]
MSTDPSRSTPQLLTARRFGPLFLTQFCGAFNDNLFKNALILLVAFHTGKIMGMEPAMIVQLAAGLFILPFFLFSAMAGQLADKYDKARLIRIIKLIEIGIAAVATFGFATAHGELLLAALFMMGLHSTFFGPLKYSILPQHLHEDELVAGNAWVESATFVAILAGSLIAGPLMAIKPNGAVYAGATCVLIAIAGYVACRGIPDAPPAAPDLRISLNPLTETWRNIRLVYRNRTVFHSVMGISWFWFYGALFLTQFAPYVKEVLGGNELMYSTLLGTFIVGIALGSFLCERLSGKHVEIGLVPLGSIGLTLAGIDLWLASPTGAPTPTDLAGFVSHLANWRILADLVLIGISGGFFTVPLYALIQSRSEPGERSRVIAANNILNSAFMVVSAGFAAVALGNGLSIPQIFLITALMNAMVAVYIYGLVPEFLIRCIVWVLIKTVYRLRASGLEHVPEKGAALIVCNHPSFIDALIISAMCRRPIRWVADYNMYAKPGLNYFFRTIGAIPMAAAREDRSVLVQAYDRIAATLESGELVGIFPEGRVTDTGNIEPFKGGINKILKRNPVPVVPMALRGMWGSFFSRKDGPAMSKPLRRGFFNHIELIVSTPVAPENLTPSALHDIVQGLRGAQP